MPTKLGAGAGRTRIESPNVAQTVEVDEDWTGTAIELLRTLEETDVELQKLEVGVEMGGPKVTLWNQYGHDGEAQPVPESVHSQLAEWGYEHGGESHDNHSHRDDVRAQIYVK